MSSEKNLTASVRSEQVEKINLNFFSHADETVVLQSIRYFITLNTTFHAYFELSVPIINRQKHVISKNKYMNDVSSIVVFVKTRFKVNNSF